MQKTTGRKKAEEYYNVQKKQHYPTNREQALSQLHFFVEELFDRFGDLQDAMYERDDFVHHSLLSVALNY
jgi:deoxyribodipyrimidine photolyase-related protein